MDFKEWLEEKIICDFENMNDFEESSNIQYIGTTTDILEKVYNLYNDTKILDVLKFYSLTNNEYYDIVIAQESFLIDIDVIFDTIRYLNYHEILNNLSLEDFKYKIMNKDDNIEDNFYVLLALNPYELNLDYVQEVEALLNENISLYNNTDLLYTEFMNLIKTNDQARLLIETNFNNFAIICFDSLEKYDKYFTNRDDSIKNMTSAQNDMIDKLKSILPDDCIIVNTDEIDTGTEDDIEEFYYKKNSNLVN